MSDQPPQGNYPPPGSQPPPPQGYPPPPQGYPPPPQGYPPPPQSYPPPPQGYPPPPQGYPGQPQGYAAPPPGYGYPAPAAPAARQPLYAIAAVGGLVLIVSAFLSWVEFKTDLGTVKVNGLGSASGPEDIARAVEEGDVGGDGVITIILGVAVIAFAVGALMLGRRPLGIAALVAGALGLAFMVSSTSTSTVTSTRSGSARLPR